MPGPQTSHVIRIVIEFDTQANSITLPECPADKVLAFGLLGTATALIQQTMVARRMPELTEESGPKLIRVPPGTKIKPM